MNALNFIKVALKDYKVGAVMVSSRYTIKQILLELKPNYKYIVEYGAGNGVITKEILKTLPADGKVIAIELNQELLTELRTVNDPRLIIVNGDALEISKDFSPFHLPRIDAIISGIPFTFIEPKQRRTLITNTHAALAPKGIFIVYQISLLIFPLLKKYFGNVRFRFEPRNFPPYFIITAEK